MLCLDNDAAGKAGEERIFAMLQKANIEANHLGLLPEGGDINSLFMGGR
jgi:DNA primase